MPSPLNPPSTQQGVCACYLGHGLMNNRSHTHRGSIQAHTHNKLSLYSWLPIVFTVANTFPRQHLNLGLSAGLCLSVSLRVTWQGANLGPYLRPQLCSHSLLHEHLICHHCQSEQIRLPQLSPLLHPPRPLTCPLPSLASPQHLSHISHTDKQNLKVIIRQHWHLLLHLNPLPL